MRVRVWDAPTRLFHWAIVVLVCTSWVTQYVGRMEWHMLSGYTILTLLLFRLAWGFAGSDTARFGRFLKSPLAAVRHLSHLARREPDTEIGHNPAGGWMVLVMLALLLVQAGTGLFSNDDVMTEGPLMHLVGNKWSAWLTGIHDLNFTLIEIAVALHVLAILTYALLKRQNLLGPMFTGRKWLPATTSSPRIVSPIRAAALLVAAAGLVVLLLKYAS
ncbi:MAG TPA: cytochrome b/b6 domain-containing protein [Acetobacteraceae bacterium]